MSELHDGGTAAVQAADVQKRFTKKAFLFVSEGEKGKTAKAATTKTTHQACTTSLANSSSAISRHLGKSINIQHQHKCIPLLFSLAKYAWPFKGEKGYWSFSQVVQPNWGKRIQEILALKKKLDSKLLLKKRVRCPKNLCLMGVFWASPLVLIFKQVFSFQLFYPILHFFLILRIWEYLFQVYTKLYFLTASTVQFEFCFFLKFIF